MTREDLIKKIAAAPLIDNALMQDALIAMGANYETRVTTTNQGTGETRHSFAWPNGMLIPVRYLLTVDGFLVQLVDWKIVFHLFSSPGAYYYAVINGHGCHARTALGALLGACLVAELRPHPAHAMKEPGNASVPDPGISDMHG